MRDIRTALVATIWLACAATVVAATAMVLYESAHPHAEAGRQRLWLLYATPYTVIGASTWAFRRRTGMLAIILAATVATAAFGTFARYSDLDTALFILDARAVGRVAMNCGPPLGVFAMVLEFGLALIAAAGAMRLLPSRP